MAENQPITKLNVSISEEDKDILSHQGYKIINVNLNSGTTGNPVFLWYKKEIDGKPITRIQLSYTCKMKQGLYSAGYEQVAKDLNAGNLGDHLFLWHFSGDSQYDFPIVDLQVTTHATLEPEHLKNGFERVGCDLNRNAGGDYVYLWVKRQKPTYIYEIKVSTSFDHDMTLFQSGYTRVDENTNRGAGGAYVYLWYRRTTEQSKALTTLDVSINKQDATNLLVKGYKKFPGNLNMGTTGSDIYLWTKDDSSAKIQALILLVNPDAKKEYQLKGINVIDKNLNNGNKGVPMYLAYK